MSMYTRTHAHTSIHECTQSIVEKHNCRIYTSARNHTCMPTEDTRSSLFKLNPGGMIIHRTVSSLQGSRSTYENLHTALHPAQLFSPSPHETYNNIVIPSCHVT